MTAGRPTAYKAAFAKQVKKIAELGATDQEVAEKLALIRKDESGIARARKDKRNSAKRRRLSQSPSLRVRNSISARMWAALKGRSDGALFSRLGFAAEELKHHLEISFSDGMSWENYGRWHIDHKKPCASFDLTDLGQFNECWSLTNLQPLWATDNVTKGAKYASS